MKLILSRKGFDSSSGGCPNPIFPDGSLLALPIPDPTSKVKYRDIAYHIDSKEHNLGTLVHQLTNGKVRGLHGAHLDPDMDPNCYPRAERWRPLLGQHGSAQGHLRNQGVSKGDVFVFFGLFKSVERVKQRWQFVKDAKPRHVMWGWMFVGDVLEVDGLTGQAHPWLTYHPHLQWPDETNNTLYLSSSTDVKGLPGFGLFENYNERLCLTDLSSQRPSDWRLPKWMFPCGRPPLSYHNKEARWTQDKQYCHLTSAARGQEFVLDIDHYPEALDWLKSLIG